MIVLAMILAWGTLIEKTYGADVSQFFLYNTTWFALLLGILAVNILCSALSRLPWKYHHLPFLSAHLGILVLLVGCLVSWLHSQEGRILLWEGWAVSEASNSRQQVFTLRSIAHHSSATDFEDQSVPFTSGPLPWRYYDPKIWDEQIRSYRFSLGLASRWARRDQGPMSLPAELKGVQIEPLDYLANSDTEPVDPLEVNLLWARPLRSRTETGEISESPRNWERARLEIRTHSHPMLGTLTPAANRSMAGGEQVCFSMAANMEEVRAFLASAPDWTKESGPQGQIVLYYNGDKHYIDPQKLLEHTVDGKRYLLPGTNLEMGDVRFQYRMFLFRFKIYTTTGEEVAMQLQPRLPELNQQGTKLGIFGTYWLSPPPQMAQIREHMEGSSMAMLGLPRLEFLQGTDRKLYYRYWTGKDVAAVGPVPMTEGDDKVGPEWTIAVGTPEEVKVAVKQFTYQDIPGKRVVSRPFLQENSMAVATPRLRVKVTVDGKEEIFWTELDDSHYPSLSRYLPGDRRTVTFVWNHEQFDLGFGILLKKFDERTEPGGKIPSHFSSLVDFGPALAKKDLPQVRYTEFHATEEDIRISMNRPAIREGNGKRYRLYQLERRGPFTPLQPFFFQYNDGEIFPWETAPRETVYCSILKASYDPGSGLKYLGSFLIVFGTCWFCLKKRK